MAKRSLNSNELIAIFKARAGQEGFNQNEFTEFVLNTININAGIAQFGGLFEQTFTDAGYTVLESFDAVTITNDNLVADLANNKVICLLDGIYKLTGGLSISFAGADELGVAWFVNEAPLNPNPIPLAGEGVTNPIIVTWERIITLVEGDEITIRCQNDLPGNLNADIFAGYLNVARIG